ncbi:MAG: hypothetical protein ABEJ88_03845 [Halobacterium sp.]
MRKTKVLVAALLVLAGCGGNAGTAAPSNPQPTDSTTPDATTAPGATTTSSPERDPVEHVNVTERGATLGDVNATKVWERVDDMVDVDAEPPPVVVRPRPTEQRVTPTPFEASFGATNATYDYTLPGGLFDTQLGRYRVVVWRPPGATDAQVEYTLAHEFLHAHQVGVYGLSGDRDDLAAMTATEGVTEYLAWRYAEQYTDYDAEAALRELFADLPPMGRAARAEYYFSATYARNHTDPDAPFRSMNENRPTTAEQVLHGLAPGSEPPRPLTVHGQSGNAGVFLSALVETEGEAQLRFLLQYGLSRARAARAAAGWGNDRVATFRRGGSEGFAWVIRWDSRAEAREFERLFADFDANVSEPLRLEAVGEETTVVLAGSPAFVGNATVTGTAANVTVAAGD